MIVTAQQLDEVVARLSIPGFKGLDTETTGLSEDDRLFSLIISDEHEAYYFNFICAPNTPDDCVLPRDATFVRLAPIFNDPHNSWFIHNAKFDLRMVSKEGSEIAGEVHCTQAIERVVKNNYIDGYGLDKCARRRGLEKDSAVEEYITKHKLYDKTTVPGKKKIIKVPHYDRVPFDVMAPYGCTDAILHRALGEDQRAKILALSAQDERWPSLAPVFENEKRLTKTCFRMERRGVLIDKPRTAKALEFEMTEVNKAKTAFHLETGEIYADSRVLFQKVFDKLGSVYPMTKAGNPSFAAEVLEEMDSPAANLINNIRHHEKRAGTYYSSFLHYATTQGVIHANVVQGGTEPGRMSYRDPNLQNVPKEDDEADQHIPYHVRECFVPRPGFKYYSLDYNQMEYRMMFDYAGDLRFISRVLAGEDIHQVTAEMCGIARKHAKTLNFAILYGAGEEKIAKMLGVTIREARELRAMYFGRMPKVQTLINQIKEKGEARGFVFNWFGRRCHIADRSWAYILPNHTIQGGCADVVKIAMNRIDDWLQGHQSAMLLQVHDELLFEVKDGHDYIIPAIANIMENVYEARNGMVLSTSIDHSRKSWGYRDKVKGIA